jgi:putative ABC transport system permease protein
MKALDRALFRDLSRLRAQVLTLSLVVAAGASVFVAMKVTVDALETGRAEYFRAQRFGDLFASLKRAPRAVLTDLASVPGVAQVEGRVVGDVPAFLAGHAQPSTVHLVSIDARGVAPLNAVRLRAGRLPSPERDDEVVLNEPFSEATHLLPGDALTAVLNGRLRRLHVVGVGIAPDLLFQLPAGAVAPNDERYGAAWMLRAPLEAAFDLGGAFNDLVIRLGPEASESDVKAAVDRILAPYAGRDAYGRDEQMSAKNLDMRIGRIRGMLVMVPTLFLLVAAFVLNVVLGRLVQAQREQIGTLKAFGYTNARLARHYLGLALLAVVPGAFLGVVGGLEMGRAYTALFLRYFRLPPVGGGIDVPAVAGALVVVFAAAALGALGAMRGVTRLHPVEAMRPPSPPMFRRGLLERWRVVRRVPAALLMVVRNLRLAPLRAVASIAALAFGTALCVTGSFFGGSIDELVHHVFDIAMREDLSVSFVRPISRSACGSLAGVDGVVACEPLTTVPVRARFRAASRQIVLTAVDDRAQLRRVVDREGHPVAVPPPGGLLVSRRLLGRLGAGVGDAITIETLEGRPRRAALPVLAALDDEMGLNVYLALDTLRAVLGEEPTMTQALLRVAPGHDLEVVRRLAAMPTVVGESSREAAIVDFEKAIAQTMRVMTAILALLSAALAIAVVYNGARVALAERARDLASLRVLGFTRSEVFRLLVGEMALELAVAVPLGLWLGHSLARLTVDGMAADEFRLPFVITLGTYALAALVVVGAAVLSALQLRRLIDRLDLVAVLKTRE